MAEHGSQAQYGPHLTMSFHDFVEKITDVEYFYSLSKSENRLLLKIALRLDRTGNVVQLRDLKKHKLETWAAYCRFRISHASRYMGALKELDIIEEVQEGRRHYYRLTVSFCLRLIGEMSVVSRVKEDKKKRDSYQTGQLLVNEKTELNTVENVDKSDDSYQTGYLTVTKPGNIMLPNRVTNSYQTGQPCSYIEDFSSNVSLPPITSSSFPSDAQPVDNGDNYNAQEKHLAEFYDSMPLQRSRAFISKLTPFQLNRLNHFLTKLARDNQILDVRGMNLTWVKWSAEQDRIDGLGLDEKRPQNQN